MKSVYTLLATLAAAATTLAQRQSAPFYLVAISDDPKVNGTHFEACHEGAAIESLCVGPKKVGSDSSFSTYRLNNTKSYPNEGVLSWVLHSAGNVKCTQPKPSTPDSCVCY
jgi:hypothetical protein